MQDLSGTINLPAAEAACLEALRSGDTMKSRIAIHAGIDLDRATRALRRLADKGLATAVRRSPRSPRRWRPTPRGRRVTISVVPDPKPRRAFNRGTLVQPDSSTERLLHVLNRPKRTADLPAELGISRQRVQQIITRLLAHGLLRSADPGRPTRLVARTDDPTVLLRYDEEMVLSAMPDEADTTIAKLSRALRIGTDRTKGAVAALIAQGLVETSGTMRDVTLYRRTAEGSKHPQRDRSAKRAEAPALPVKSDRVRSVLHYFCEHGPTRTAKIARDLGIVRHSMNALMQYLKRRGLARKAGDSFDAPHEITSEGRLVYDEMLRRSG
jgi:DNA-binding MarR family transcriptional regulator